MTAAAVATAVGRYVEGATRRMDALANSFHAALRLVPGGRRQAAARALRVAVVGRAAMMGVCCLLAARGDVNAGRDATASEGGGCRLGGGVGRLLVLELVVVVAATPSGKKSARRRGFTAAFVVVVAVAAAAAAGVQEESLNAGCSPAGSRRDTLFLATSYVFASRVGEPGRQCGSGGHERAAGVGSSGTKGSGVAMGGWERGQAAGGREGEGLGGWIEGAEGGAAGGTRPCRRQLGPFYCLCPAALRWRRLPPLIRHSPSPNRRRHRHTRPTPAMRWRRCTGRDASMTGSKR